MASRFRRRKDVPAHTLLGVAEGAETEELNRAASQLRDHIVERQTHSDEEPFREARQEELNHLDRTLAASSNASDGGGRRGPRLSPQILGVALLLLIAVGAIRYGLSHRSAASIPEAPAQLSVLSDPQGGSFWLLDPSDESVLTRDEADGGNSEWPGGDYLLRVEHPDCPDEWSREITLPAGGSKAFEPRLCQGEGQVVIRGSQEGDRVQIDGLDVGSTSETPRTLRVGKHRIQVEKEGFVPFTAEISLRPDEQIDLMAALKPKNEKPATPAPRPPAAAAPPPPPPPAARPPSAVPPSPSDPPLPQAKRGIGGSKTWHDAVKHDLISTYDQNGSRSLDTREEVLSIPCSVWLDIETQYETGGLSVDMTHMYGFDGTDAPANTLGVTYGLRGEAYQRMKDCGLKGRL